MDSLKEYVPYITALNSISLVGVVIIAVRKYKSFREELDMLQKLKIQNTKRITNIALALRQQRDTIHSLQKMVQSLHRNQRFSVS